MDKTSMYVLQHPSKFWVPPQPRKPTKAQMNLHSTPIRHVDSGEEEDDGAEEVELVAGIGFGDCGPVRCGKEEH